MELPPALRELWKDKPLFIAVVVGTAGLLYILYRNNRASIVAPTTPETGSSGMGTAIATYPEYNIYNSTPLHVTVVPASNTAASPATTVPTTVVSSPSVASPPATNTPSGTTPTPTTRVYVVKSGDTLSGIAARFGTTWQALYQKNKAVIDSTSAAHGNPIPGGPWNNIFPGEQITY